MELNLDYKVQYAGAGVVHTSCKECKKHISINNLMIAKMVQSKSHDGKDPLWFHSDCFFIKHSVAATSDIENFENIMYDDQLKIISKIDPKTGAKYEKIAQKRKIEKDFSYKNFAIDYASTNLEECATCHEKINQGEARIRSIVYDSEKAEKFGKEILWAHMTCFALDRKGYKYPWDGKLLEGFEALKPEHQVFIAETLPATVKLEVKKPRIFSPLNEEDLEEKIAKQTEELLRIRLALQNSCELQDIEQLLFVNDQEVQSDDFNTMLDRGADILTFGSLYKCQKCNKGEMIFSKFGYTCNAWVDEWVKCGNFQTNPLRMKCFIPEYLKQNEFFATCEPKVEDRAVRPIVIDLDDDAPSTSTAGKTLKKNRQQKTAVLQMKDGTVVDPKSNHRQDFHVYRKDNVLYSCVLGLTDIQRNKNSFYKLQVLESDSSARRYVLFTSWGRIGTNIGSLNEKYQHSAESAVAEFELLYAQQTGNDWKMRDKFVKIPGKFYSIDVKYGNEVQVNKVIPSQLNPQVQDLMKLLFNIKNMQITMKQFKLDLQKMPLGKLSAKQLESAKITLIAIELAIESRSTRHEFIGLSNKFFTLIPHNFGFESAPIIDTLDMVNKKREMVEFLNDIETTYGIMNNQPSVPMNSLDSYYNQLNAKVEPLDRNSEMYKLIKIYIKNTSVHGFKISILEVFKVEREGEAARYAQFENFPNRQLLWHGSRITNFASIVKNGLKISPQINGSMFGRGIYFADMVSKSANYCKGLDHGGGGLLALCEVALGNVCELNQPENITNLSPQFNSVKGVGITQPDMYEAYMLPNQVVIPLGKPPTFNSYANTMYGILQQQMNTIGKCLQYNEYIVYNEAQIKIQYLVKFKQN